MSKLINMFKLNAEADLFDSKAYIAKTFLAIATAYLVATKSQFISKDMISVLFGLMLTLEPVTLTGIRNGWEQVYATLIGAVVTAIIVGIFGINVLTIAFSVSFTLYVCLRINWKAVSPVAIFTSIYMTQYVQVTEAGDPSMLLTFQLRVLALGTGVIIAIIYNFLFSIISYKRMKDKRMVYIFNRTINHLQRIMQFYKDKDSILNEKRELPNTFNDIDWFYGLLEDMKLDNKIFNIIGLKRVNNIDYIQSILFYVRNINHLIYDITIVLLKEDLQKEQINIFEQIIDELVKIQKYFISGKKGKFNKTKILELEGHTRLSDDINDLIRNIDYLSDNL